ncbi:MAG TPA: hypothetical protein VFU15_09445, partial [Bacteroidia bacterium]|nr:hypothetical protein [Bacteroidia bacterium]
HLRLDSLVGPRPSHGNGVSPDLKNDPAKKAGEQEEKRAALLQDSLLRADSVAMAVKETRKDSVMNDSTMCAELTDAAVRPDSSGAVVLPVFFIAFDGISDNAKAGTPKYQKTDPQSGDVNVYDEQTLKSDRQQTWTFGARAGYFISRHFALLAGGNASRYVAPQGTGNLKFNHNHEYLLNFHTATSSFQLPSGSFTADDSNTQQGDTFHISVQSYERYRYFNLRLGGAFYPVRNRYFSIYIDAFCNGAYLTKQDLTLTVPKSGKTFSFSGDELSGMNRFTIGWQAGAGFEWMPVKNLGIWAEPSWFSFGTLNKKNAVMIDPSSFRVQFGLAWHFGYPYHMAASGSKVYRDGN